MSGSDEVHPAYETDRWGGWHWDDPRHGEHFRRCSYCGSVHPEDLAAEPSVDIDWSDRKYGWPHKFYAHIPNRNPEQPYVVASCTSAKPGYTLFEDLPRKQRKAVLRVDSDRYLKGRYVKLGPKPEHFGKFYSVHLADPDISDTTKQQIYQMCGLQFVFKDGKVKWMRYESI